MNALLEHQRRVARAANLTLAELYELADLSPILKQQLADPEWGSERSVDFDAIEAALDEDEV